MKKPTDRTENVKCCDRAVPEWGETVLKRPGPVRDQRRLPSRGIVYPKSLKRLGGLTSLRVLGRAFQASCWHRCGRGERWHLWASSNVPGCVAWSAKTGSSWKRRRQGLGLEVCRNGPGEPWNDFRYRSDVIRAVF